MSTRAALPTSATKEITPDRAVRASALVGLLLLGGLVFGGADPVDTRVVQLVGVPSPGWYEADDLAAAARAAGAAEAHMAAGPIADGDTVRLVSGWALPVRTLAPTATRVFGGRVSLNHGTLADLEGLPGIGPALAARIVAGRPFRTFLDLDRIKGIGPAKLRALAPLAAP